MARRLGSCKRCGASIVWAVNPATGKTCPITDIIDPTFVDERTAA